MYCIHIYTWVWNSIRNYVKLLLLLWNWINTVQNVNVSYCFIGFQLLMLFDIVYQCIIEYNILKLFYFFDNLTFLDIFLGYNDVWTIWKYKIYVVEKNAMYLITKMSYTCTTCIIIFFAYFTIMKLSVISDDDFWRITFIF